MQTFLPLPDLRESARSLDDRRLGKQRVETFQILRALTWETYGWRNHPAVAMWRGFVPALVLYGLVVCDEWVRRGHADVVARQFLDFTGGRVPGWPALVAEGAVPPWLGDDAVHAGHRASLRRKEPELYPGWADDDEGYVWPGSAWPRWPVPGAGLPGRPRGVRDAAAALRLAPADDAARVVVGDVDAGEVVAALRAGKDVDVEAPDARSADQLGALVALALPGPAAWLHAGPDLPCADPLPDPAAVLAERVSPSGTVARPPTDADRSLVAALARRTRPDVAFLRPQQRTGPDGAAAPALARARLVVVRDGGDAPAGAPVVRVTAGQQV